jgi:hypothetical protein
LHIDIEGDGVVDNRCGLGHEKLLEVKTSSLARTQNETGGQDADQNYEDLNPDTQQHFGAAAALDRRKKLPELVTEQQEEKAKSTDQYSLTHTGKCVDEFGRHVQLL